MAEEEEEEKKETVPEYGYLSCSVILCLGDQLLFYIQKESDGIARAYFPNSLPVPEDNGDPTKTFIRGMKATIGRDIIPESIVPEGRLEVRKRAEALPRYYYLMESTASTTVSFGKGIDVQFANIYHSGRHGYHITIVGSDDSITAVPVAEIDLSFIVQCMRAVTPYIMGTDGVERCMVWVPQIERTNNEVDIIKLKY